MSETIDELTVQYEEDGQVVVEELEKVVLSKGAWTTILFRYREMDRKTGELGAPKATLRRYQKQRGFFRKKDAVNISDRTAPLLVQKLSEWFELD